MPAFIPDVPYHIQAVFFVTFAYIWLSAFYGDSNYLENMPTDTQQYNEVLKANCWRAIYSIVLFMVAYAYLKPYADFRNGETMQRIQRCIVMLALVYMCWLLFMLHMRPDYGRYFLGFLDSNLNKPVTKEMHTYDDNCELEWANIWDNFDHYYVVHLCNWFLASLVIRDTYILHFWHVFDEIIELSLQHILAHFRECWWDHILMDIMLSNIPAVIAGMVFIRYTGIREMDWLGRTGKKSWKDWDVFHCHKKMGVLFYQQMLLCLHFANGFFLLNAFLIPPKHAFPILRLLGWFGFGAVGMREAYIDAETWNTPERKHKPVAGRYRWLAVAILTTETIVCYKYRMDTGNISFVPTPWYIWVPWTLSLGSLACFWAYLRFKPDHTVKYPGIEEEERKKAKKQKSIKSSPKIQRSPSRSPRKSKHE